jgi:hypothetical protein
MDREPSFAKSATDSHQDEVRSFISIREIKSLLQAPAVATTKPTHNFQDQSQSAANAAARITFGSVNSST